jgi:hypothetical protein
MKTIGYALLIGLLTSCITKNIVHNAEGQVVDECQWATMNLLYIELTHCESGDELRSTSYILRDTPGSNTRHVFIPGLK